eukprot:5174237-Pleurochrysis_carterae.AAC.1
MPAMRRRFVREHKVRFPGPQSQRSQLDCRWNARTRVVRQQRRRTARLRWQARRYPTLRGFRRVLCRACVPSVCLGTPGSSAARCSSGISRDVHSSLIRRASSASLGAPDQSFCGKRL